MAYTHSPREPIAIIGCGCRFPGDSTSPSKLWNLLHSPRDLSKTVPSESRFNVKGFYHPNGEHHGRSNVTQSYFIEEDPRLFDCGFFSIAPREAEAIDPQQRLLLETVYETMENAGLSLQGLKGSQTSVYVGSMSADYTDTQTRDVENMSQYMITGTSRALLSNRLSYFFDWHGPSISVDTACSSSLAAVHLGVQSLRNGECTASCVAGSNLIMGPDAYLAATSLHLLSPTGKSRMWDQAADGYARGEGVCALFMKTLSQALKDGDRIDALIRETCVNSDGRTIGIALPSTEAQAALISTAYKRAGLDILRAEDRPQYIEAHGTGTQAGDPREASALSQTFFPSDCDEENIPSMVVGSIKTIIGHTEGTAGIAGIVKVVLAMRHKTIPPNQHFHNLNPSVKPFYKKLQIPTAPQEWPPVPLNQPLRASVNGFGSGGTNCHAIVESYVPEIHDQGPWGRPDSLSGPRPSVPADVDFISAPLVFSANSESALVAMLERYALYLEDTNVSLQRLAMTLNSRRSTLSVRIAFAGASKRNILEAINKQLAKARASSGAAIGTRPPVIEFDNNRRPRILGVFTGQGAQWPGMGQSLMRKCAVFRKMIESMEQSLAQLPDPPTWSLTQELMASPEQSRTSEAELSLPLCAAVQVGLVHLLSQAGITFHTVVGHSGGEIGAAYAAAKISAADAIRIAYYRGIVCKLAVGSDGRRGAMIAVGFGYEEGINFCSTTKMKGRLTVAASNSPKSVTLSGDEDAVIEAKQILDNEGLFNRILRVDTGYHSHHMLPCAEPYTAELQGYNIRACQGNGLTNWVSSVYEDNRTITSSQDTDLQAEYWTDNLIGRVLFSQALDRAFDDGRGTLDLILEVGPHPALNGPTLDTMNNKLGFEVPYSGVLDRKADDLTALANALGFVWMHLGAACVDFKCYSSTFSENSGPVDVTPLPELPTYPWDHKQVLYRESRLNRQIRSRVDPPHELLGSRTPDDTDYEPRWRNFFKLEEIPWLRDHCIQNQIIVPAATYCVMALEAARVLGKGKNIESIELSNISIARPIILDESSEGTETLLSLRSDLDSGKGKGSSIHADFSLSAGTVEDGHLRTAATGEICIHLAASDSDPSTVFPRRPLAENPELLPVNINHFYDSLNDMGLGYSGPFRAITSAERRMDMASAVVAIDAKMGKSIPIHPTWLDASFQTFLAAFAAPRDGSLWTAFMPTTIGRMTFSPNPNISHQTSSVIVDAHLTEFIPGFQATLPTICGDMSIYSSSTNKLEVQIEDFKMSSFLPATEKDDKLLFLKTVWQQDILSEQTFDTEPNLALYEARVIDACEKAITYYLSKLGMDVSFHDAAQNIPGLSLLAEKAAARSCKESISSDLNSVLDEFGGHIDMMLIKAIGEGLLTRSSGTSTVSGQTSDSQITLVSRWHNEGLGFAQVHNHMRKAVRQISHRYKSLRLLQIGPSSTNFVNSICQELLNGFISYTIIDESAESIDDMKAQLKLDQPNIIFKVLDVESGPEVFENAVAPGSIDLVIVHKAFRKQATALRTIRNALKPGAFMIMMAATGDQLRFPFFLLSTPPRLIGEDPIANATREQTQGILQDSGFSGIDSMSFDNVPDKHTFTVIVSQATDDRIGFLKSPLTSSFPFSTDRKLLVLGGLSFKVANLIRLIRSKLSLVWDGEMVFVETLADFKVKEVENVEAVLSLTELDRPVLQYLGASTFKNLQLFLENSKTILWVTQGAKFECPYQSGTIGLGRTFQSENSKKHLQFLDLDNYEGSETLIAESFLRLIGGTAIVEVSPEYSHIWSIEPELAVQDGKFLIPRIFHDRERNDRLNSLRRKVETKILTGKRPIVLRQSVRNGGEISYTADEIIPFPDQTLPGDLEKIELTIDYCSIEPVMPNNCGRQFFCCIGRSKEGERFLSLSLSNSSIVTVPRAWAIPLNSDEDAMTPTKFTNVLNEMKSYIIEKAMTSGFTTIFYEFDVHLAASIDRRVRISNMDFIFLDDQPNSVRNNHVVLKPFTSRAKLQSMFPHKTKLLIRLGRGNYSPELLAIQQALPKGASIISYHDLDTSALAPHDALSTSLACAENLSLLQSSAARVPMVLKASVIVKDGIKNHPNAAVVDWTGEQQINLTQRPVDPSRLFSPHKTYLLMGLSGHIGQSICRWMVRNGARYIVVTSRNPNKEALWTHELQKQGATIVIEAADVTKMGEVMDLRLRMHSTMPPIGGVANGAMVMSNSLFADMTFESFQKVLRPKVEGSKILDEVFSKDDLDFFILFSSISAVTGQRSQANYAAANNFMVGLAAQRRTRNLPASVIDIGMIIGIGFIQRTDVGEGTGIMEILQKQDYMPVSERDLHHLLAEAIVAGQSEQSPEIVTGLETRDTVSGNSPFWHRNLLFFHLVKDASLSEADQVLSNVQKNLKEKLTDALGRDDALQIIEGALLAYLSSSLKLSIESIYTDVPIIDLGIDSLVAVEIRNWIFSETGHDIPVLKILGGSSVKQICGEVVADLSFGDKQTPNAKTKPQTTPKTQTARDWNIPSADASSLEVSSADSQPDDTASSSISSSDALPPPDSAGDMKTASLSAEVASFNNVESLPTPLKTEALSLGQSRLYFLSQYLNNDSLLNCTASYALSGNVDISRLEKSLEAVTQRHETLRTIFFTSERDGQPTQGVLAKSTFKLNLIPGISDKNHVKREFDRIHHYHYCLETGDTFIASLLKHGPESYTIVFGYHHIIMDGVSWQVFQRELAQFYDSPNPLSSSEAPQSQYIDFTLKQQREISDGAYDDKLRFFQEQFNQSMKPLPLFPFAKVATRKPLTRYMVRDVITHVSSDVVTALKQTSQNSRSTSFHFYLSALQVLLHRFLDISHFCIGLVDANRSDQQFSSTIGFFLETIPVLFEVEREQNFVNLLQATRMKTYTAFAQTGIPTEEILRACNIQASTTETPLFQVVMNYRMGASRTSSMQGVDVKFLEYADAKNPFDLVLSVDELDDGTAMLTFSLQDYLYDQEGAELLANTYTNLLDTLSKDTTSPVGSISLFDASLALQTVALGTGPQVELPPLISDTLSKIINTWIDEDPEGLAVKDVNGNAKSYLQLSERADAIASTLLNAGSVPSSLICVLLDPGVDTIATILAILRTGATYVPLDVRSGDRLLGEIIEQSGCEIILHHGATCERAKELLKLSGSDERVHLITLDTVPQTVQEKVQDISAPNDLAMILYTSGTTGKPKGIPLSNANIRTSILSASRKVPLGREVVLQQSGQGFDAAIFQIFIALVNGGTLIMADNRGHPAELAALMGHNCVTCAVFIVSEMQSMLKYGYEELRDCPSWRIVMIAGETFTSSLLEQLLNLNRPDFKIINAYGPTEASICSSMYEIVNGKTDTEKPSLSIGRAIGNYRTYVVDKNCKPVPVGWPGEIAISGPGVASGYLALPGLTERKFKKTALDETSDWDRLYLTGDKGRMLSDGSIVVSGRIDGDDQVKIRGMRVQLNDVSQALLQASSGTFVDVTVLSRLDDLGDHRLVAYVVFARASHVEDKKAYLRRFVQELQMPPHMRPSIIIPLDTFPVTERGKLDSQKLANLPLPTVDIEEETDDQFTETESRLRDIWKNVLGDISSLMPINRNSDFFSVGGNSLLLLPLKSEIKRVFGIDISLPELFRASTLELLAARLGGGFKTVDIDWKKETELDDRMFATNSTNGLRVLDRSGGISVLLTGATGFLGTGILRQLIQSPQVTRVHCAAIRSNSQTRIRELNLDSPKIIRHSGDLALPNLGMGQAQLDDLLHDVDVIIHNGAEVSHMKNYRSLRATNVLSTIELASLAVRGRIPIHYISTGGVARLSGATVQSESSLAAFHPPTDGTDGYVASKWASEVILENVFRRFQGNIWIHRPSSITSDNVPALDIVHSVLNFSRSMKAVPDLTGSTGAFDFVHIDTVSANIATCALESTNKEGNHSNHALVYVHQSGDDVVPVDQLKKYLEGSEVGSYKVLPFQEWLDGALEKGLDEAVGSFLASSKGVIQVPLLQRSNRTDRDRRVP